MATRHNLIMMCILMILHLYSAMGAFYELHEILEGNGLGFEERGEIQLTIGEWKLVTHLSTEDFEYKLGNLQQAISEAEKICAGVANISVPAACLRDLPLIRRSIERTVQVISNIIEVASPKRKVRGYINAVGDVLKTLFGTLSEDDRLHYDSLFQNLQKNNNLLKHALNDETTILNSTIQSISTTFNNFQFNQNQLKTSIKNISIELIQFQKNIMNVIEIESQITEVISILVLGATDFELEVDRLIDALLFIENGIMHPTLLPDNLLINTLKSISLPKDHYFPVVLNSEGVRLLKRVWRLTALRSNHNILITCHIPLTDNLSFKLLKPLPIPTPWHDDIFYFTNPAESLIASDANKSTNFDVDQNILESCRRMRTNMLLCPQNRVVFHTDYSRKCELTIFKGLSVNYQQCDTRFVKIITSIFIPLQTNDSWIVIPSSPKAKFTVTCNNKYIQLHIPTPSVLKLQNNCVLYSDHSVLKSSTHTSSSTNLTVHFSQFNFNFTPTIRPDSLDSLAPLPISVNYKSTEEFTARLNTNSRKLGEVKHTLKAVTYNYSEVPMSVYYHAGIGISLVAIVSLAACWYKHSAKTKHRSRKDTNHASLRMPNGQRLKLSPQDLEQGIRVVESNM